MKFDPYNHERRFHRWKQRTELGIQGLAKEDSDLIKRFIRDMEFGLNVSMKSTKGPRSFVRLNTLSDKMTFFARTFQREFGVPIAKISEEQLHEFINRMRSGELRTRMGEKYKSVPYYVSTFKAFWHWHMNVERRNGNNIPDITLYVDARPEQPPWVYLSEQDVKRLCNNANYYYRVLMMFMFDSGIRSPTELMNVRVEDLSNDCKQLHIREEASKTFARRITLLLCSDALRDYLRESKLAANEYLFTTTPSNVNRYLQRLAIRVLGDKVTLAGDNYKNLTMYDFRHSSACYWLPRYKSESALKYRFGWKKSEQIHYYTNLLGMTDNISSDDLLVGESRTLLERELAKSEHERMVLQDRLVSIQEQLSTMLRDKKAETSV